MKSNLGFPKGDRTMTSPLHMSTELAGCTGRAGCITSLEDAAHVLPLCAGELKGGTEYRERAEIHP